MKINVDLTKALLETVAKTTLDKFTNNATAADQSGTLPHSMNAADARPVPVQTDSSAEARPRNAQESQPQEPFAQILRGIGTQVTAAVTEALSSQVDKKVAEAVDVAEQAVDRQRVTAIKQMQALVAAERAKTVDALQKTAAALSTRILVSAGLIGGSLLMVAAALFLHK